MRFNLLLISFLVYSTGLLAQYQGAVYQYYDGVKVYRQDGVEQNLAWCGGFNNPQFSMGDLNNDGKQDLVVYESGRWVKTFINTGTQANPIYTYEPKYELNFPPTYDYLILKDYNRDGVPDMFEQGSTGYVVYKGYYNAQNELCFTYYKNLYYFNDSYTNGPANAYNNPGDIPAIVDVDNDGDLDFISYDVLGGNLNFYQNEQVELGLDKDSISIKLKDRCWGKVYQGFYRTHYLQYDCDESGLNKPSQVTHVGNTPCLFDYDGDGDYDYLDGSISFNEMTFLLNGKAQYGVDSMIAQDTTWQQNGKIIELPLWPAAFNVDVDQDGLADLLIAPNAINTSENYKCVWFYKNESTPGHPAFVFQSDTFMIDKMIDLGTAAYPALFDYDKDGKPDLFIGSDGYMQNDGTLRSRISYYRNTSTAGAPSFTLVTKDFLGLSSYGFSGIAPTFGDLDNDGKTDLLIGHSDGTMSLLSNTAAAETAQPVWQMSQQILKDNNSNPISVNDHAAPFIYDVNKDGKPDLVIGERSGYLVYYQNSSALAGYESLTLVNSQLGGVKSDPDINLTVYSTPFIGKMDNSNRDYLLVGGNSGNLYRFTGIENGGASGVTYQMIDSQYSFIDSTYLNYTHPVNGGAYSNFRVAPVVGDIDGDGKYEMIVGYTDGGVKLYKQMTDVGVANVPSGGNTPLVNIYPNPAHDRINLSWNSAFSANKVMIRIMNMEGQEVMPVITASSQNNNTMVSVATLPAGVYLCEVTAGTNKYYNRFSVLK